jgi:predicted nucleic acid-binding protein
MDKRDAHHNDSLKIQKYLDEFKEKTVINTTVLVETLNRSVGVCEVLKDLHDQLYDENIVVQLTNRDYLKSLEINSWFGNSINYSDCTIISSMMDMGITRIVSFDGGFEDISMYEVISSV